MNKFAPDDMILEPMVFRLAITAFDFFFVVGDRLFFLHSVWAKLRYINDLNSDL